MENLKVDPLPISESTWIVFKGPNYLVNFLHIKRPRPIPLLYLKKLKILDN
jgi:hypothetical protein